MSIPNLQSDPDFIPAQNSSAGGDPDFIPAQAGAAAQQYQEMGGTIPQPSTQGFWSDVAQGAQTMASQGMSHLPRALQPEGLSLSHPPEVLQREAAQPLETAGQMLGGLGEQAGEYALGDAGLEWLGTKLLPLFKGSYLSRLKSVQSFLQTAADHPAVAKALAVGLRQGTVTGAQELEHGATPAQAAVGAGVGTLIGGGLEGAGQYVGDVTSRIRPGEVNLAGERAPVLASQGAEPAPLAAKVTTIGEQPLIARQQQAAGKQAVKNLANESAQKTLTDLSDHLEFDPDQYAQGIESYGQSADAIKNAAKEHFYTKVNEATGNNFADLQNKIKNAYRNGDYSLVDSLQVDMDDLLRNHADDLGPKAYRATKDAYRKSYIHDAIGDVIDKSYDVLNEDVAKAAPVARNIVGTRLRTGLNRVQQKYGTKAVQDAIGPDALSTLTKIADLTKTVPNAEAFNSVLDEMGGEAIAAGKLPKGTINATRKLLLNRIATNPGFADFVEDVTKNGKITKAMFPVILPSFIGAHDVYRRESQP
jgi:hypothetical protein